MSIDNIVGIWNNGGKNAMIYTKFISCFTFDEGLPSFFCDCPLTFTTKGTGLTTGQNTGCRTDTEKFRPLTLVTFFTDRATGTEFGTQ